MHYLKDKGFVLRRVNFGDADRYITIFTKNHGKIEVVAKGIRKITSRRGPSVELFNLIEFQVVKGAKNYILTETQLMNSFSSLKRNLEGARTVFLICELTDSLLPMGVKHYNVFRLLLETIKRLGEESTDKVIHDFELNLLSILGYWDKKEQFKSEDHIRTFIEQILERKIRTYHTFK